MDKVTFYVGEDLEFHTGRFWRDLTLAQAINLYKGLLDAKGIRGIGIKSEKNGEWDLLMGNTINITDLNYVTDIRDMPETQEALEALKKAFPDYEIV